MKENYLKLGVIGEREADILDRCVMTGKNFEDYAGELRQAVMNEYWEAGSAESMDDAWNVVYKDTKAYADAWKAQPLVASLERGHVEFFDEKIAEGTDVNARDADGLTALHHSARGQTEIVVKLLQHGADPRLSDNNGLTPIRYANASNALLLAAAQAEYDVRDLVATLDAGGDIEARDEDGFTPLLSAVYAGQTSTTALLLDRGASVSAVDDNFRRTPLHWAAVNGDIETANLLLERGASISVGDASRKTPLQVAVYEGHDDMVAMFYTHFSAHDLAITIDTAHPPETLPEPPARVRLSNDPMDRPRREKLGEPDPQPIKPGRMRL